MFQGFLLRTGSKAFDSRFSVTFFAQAKKRDQLTSESMSCLITLITPLVFSSVSATCHQPHTSRLERASESS